jgi:hypothetical protein
MLFHSFSATTLPSHGDNEPSAMNRQLPPELIGDVLWKYTTPLASWYASVDPK